MHLAVRDGGTGNCLKRSLTPLSAANRFIFFCMQVQPPECGFSACKSSLDIFTVLQVGDLGILWNVLALLQRKPSVKQKKKNLSCKYYKSTWTIFLCLPAEDFHNNYNNCELVENTVICVMLFVLLFCYYCTYSISTLCECRLQ